MQHCAECKVLSVPVPHTFLVVTVLRTCVHVFPCLQNLCGLANAVKGLIELLRELNKALRRCEAAGAEGAGGGGSSTSTSTNNEDQWIRWVAGWVGGWLIVWGGRVSGHVGCRRIAARMVRGLARSDLVQI